jgi:hypothetical protein
MAVKRPGLPLPVGGASLIVHAPIYHHALRQRCEVRRDSGDGPNHDIHNASTTPGLQRDSKRQHCRFAGKSRRSETPQPSGHPLALA